MSHFIVTEKAMRPASSERRCFYCHEPIGVAHKDDCVLVSKKVIVNLSVDLEVRVPAHWTPEDVECHRNESTWCKSNVLDELAELKKKHGCLCPVAEISFVKESSEPYLDE